MDKINGLNNIVALLRKQIRNPEKKQSKSVDNRSKTDETDSTATSSLELIELEQRLLDRIKVVDPVDPDRDKKTIYIFVQTILIWELGENLLKDPNFHELVEKVSELIHSNTRLRDSLDKYLASNT